MSNRTATDEPSPPLITVGVITRDRPNSLERLLRSLEVVDDATPPFEVLVVDNSETQSARELVKGTDWQVPVRYVTEPRQGIPIARNRVLDETTSAYLAYVDDDETVRPGWLTSLMSAMTKSSAQAIRGPVFRRTAPGIPKWVAKSDALVSSPHLRDRPSLSTPTNNVLLDMAFVDDHQLRFDEWRPMTGGSDIDFFRRLSKAGGAVEWCEDALTDEYVQASRGEPRAVLQRSFRRGFSPTIRLRRSGDRFWQFTALARAVGFIVDGLALVSLTPTRRKAALFAAARQIATGCGVLWAVIGRDYDYYQDVHT